MKRLPCLIIAILITATVAGQDSTDEQKRDAAFYAATTQWFTAWTLVSQDIYHISNIRPVDLVFFDDKYVYSTSTVTIKNGQPVKGGHLANLAFKWRKALHHDSITLPDKQTVPVQLMSFAAEVPNKKNSSFFVMPLPGFWRQSGITSEELGFDNLITGVFIHEFSHSQQMQNFGKQITAFEQQYHFGIAFSDDIVQHLFEKDSSYLSLYNKEAALFYGSIQQDTLNRVLVKEGLKTMHERRERYFKGPYASLKEIDDFFLTMEGLGQYSMYLWLIHPKGGNVDKATAIAGVRRKKKWWSQEEGFALFLVLDKLTTPERWAKGMFGERTESVTALIGKALE